GLRGFTELSSHAHIDSIMCWTARSAGMEQVILDAGMRLYHQEHDRSLHSTMPLTDMWEWKSRYEEAMQAGTMLIENDDSWGLPGAELPEFVVAPTGRPEIRR